MGTSYTASLDVDVGCAAVRCLDRLTGEQRESVLIIDDSTYDRSRSKALELLSRVWDHSTGRFVKGFRMLTICWSDGVSCLPVDFALLSSKEPSKRLCDTRKQLDKRFCAYRRRKEATEKATAHLETMVKRALSAGIRAKYLLMDSWFTMPATLILLTEHMPVIGVVVEQRIAFVGGINIIDEMQISGKPSTRLDYAVCVEGPLVKAIHDPVHRLWSRVAWTRCLRPG